MEEIYKNTKLDEISLMRFNEDLEFQKYLIQNFAEIFNKTKKITSDVIIGFCQNAEIRKKVFKYFDIIRRKTKITSSKDEILDFLAEYIDDAIEYTDGFYKINVTLSNCLEECENDNSEKYNENLKKLENGLIRNIDSIIKQPIPELGYDIRFLDKMDKLKEEIKKRGEDFFINFPIEDLELAKQLSKELFGKFDERNFATMKFGNDEEIVKTMEIITKELIKYSKGNVSAEDICSAGSGASSDAYVIGDYVLKYGEKRNTPNIPNHRRILQPLIRTNIIKNDGTEKCLEVQNLGDNTWKDNLPDEVIEDILFEIYSDFRDQDMICFDIWEANVVELKKDNIPYYTLIDKDRNKYKVKPDEQATMIERQISRKVLKKRRLCCM